MFLSLIMTGLTEDYVYSEGNASGAQMLNAKYSS